MAKKSTVRVEARTRAREAAAQALARQQKLMKLAEDYFAAVLTGERLADELETRIAELRSDYAARIAKEADAAHTTMLAMSATGESAANIAALIAEPVGVVRAALKSAAVPATSEPASTAPAEAAPVPTSAVADEAGQAGGTGPKTAAEPSTPTPAGRAGSARTGDPVAASV